MARKKKHGDDHGGVHADERWLVTYADMVTLLLAVFIVLYALSDTNLRKFTAFASSVSAAFNTDVFSGNQAVTITSGQATAPDVGEMDAGGGAVATEYATVNASVADYAIENGLEGSVSVDRVPEGIAIRIRAGLLFQSGRAALDERSYGLLARIAEAVRSVPNDLRIVGNTDDTPATGPLYADNFELSAARALAVLRFLEAGGIDLDRMTIAGAGPNDPLVPNVDDESRATNRRVDVLVLYPTATEAAPTLAPIASIAPFGETP